jgi:hypothetical protein
MDDDFYFVATELLQRRARRRATINVVDVSDNVATCREATPIPFRLQGSVLTPLFGVAKRHRYRSGYRGRF